MARMRWMGGLVMMAMLLVAAPAAADDLVVQEAEDNGVKGLKASFTVNQPRAVVFGVIDDLPTFLKLFPEIQSFKILKVDGDSKDVHFEVDAVLANVEYTLRRTSKRGSKADAIAWRRLSGDANVIRGSWILTDGDKPGTTKVLYQSYVDVSAVVPTAMVRDIAMDKVEKMVVRLRGACDKKAAKP